MIVLNQDGHLHKCFLYHSAQYPKTLKFSKKTVGFTLYYEAKYIVTEMPERTVKVSDYYRLFMKRRRILDTRYLNGAC